MKYNNNNDNNLFIYEIFHFYKDFYKYTPKCNYLNCYKESLQICLQMTVFWNKLEQIYYILNKKETKKHQSSTLNLAMHLLNYEDHVGIFLPFWVKSKVLLKYKKINNILTRF